MNKKKIIIIEDDPTISQLYKERLELAGFEVGQVFNGEEGLQKTMEFKPDLVLLDLMLPKKGGINVLQILKTEPATKQMPVIVMTALLDEKYRQQTLRDGAVAHFIKSETAPEQLVAKIMDVLSEKQPLE